MYKNTLDCHFFGATAHRGGRQYAISVICSVATPKLAL